MHDDEMNSESSDRLDSLLAEAAAADHSNSGDEINSDLFLARLRARISRSRSRRNLVQLSVAAMILVGLLTWSFQDRFDFDGSNGEVSESPDPDLLLVLDVLEVLAPLDPSVIAHLEPSHFDTLEGFDSDIAALPLELLVAGEEEQR